MRRWERDPEKEAENVRTHGVGFDEAETVLWNPLAIVEPDPEHSIGEDRSRTIGHSTQGRLLVVVTSDDGVTGRIISAWRATKRERREYERGRREDRRRS